MAEKKKYDADIVGWYTRGGKRIPIRKSDRKHEDKTVAMNSSPKSKLSTQKRERVLARMRGNQKDLIKVQVKKGRAQNVGDPIKWR